MLAEPGISIVLWTEVQGTYWWRWSNSCDVTWSL